MRSDTGTNNAAGHPAAILRAETWKVALDALRANKMRALLTTLGVVIGSMCIVLVATVALTGKQYVLAQIEGIGSNLVYAQYARPSVQQPVALADEITLEDMEGVRQGIPQVVDVAGTRELPLSIVVGGLERPISAVGITEGFQRIRRLALLRGRFLDAGDIEARSKVCLLTEELAARVFPAEDPVDKPIRVGEFTFTVVGVFRERIATFGQSEIKPESIVIPISLIKYLTGTEYLRVLYAQAARSEDVPSVTRQVEEILKSRHRPGAVYRVQNLRPILEAASKISLALTVVLLVIGFIALVISGIGIMNIMLVTVTERTREIGLRKAIGARRREILYQFLIEAFLISGCGAVAGILIAVSLPVLVQPLLPGNVALPVSKLSIALAFVVTCCTGLLFGYLPANRAAQLQPTESLRYE